jgi:hypothetical protein
VRRLMLPSLAAFALIASACITAEIEVRVNEDGSGTFSVLFAADRQTLEAIAEGEDLGDPADEIDPSTLPPGATVETVDTDDLLGVKVTVPFAAGADVGAAIEETFAAVSGDDGAMLTGESGLFEAFTLVREGDTWRFAANTESLDRTGEDAEAMAMAQAMMGDVKLIVRIALPGEVITQNADRVEGDGALTWEVSLLSPEGRTLSATSEVGGGGMNVALIAGIVIGVLVLAALGGLALSRRRTTSATPEMTQAPAE